METTTKQDKIGDIIKQNGAFFAFGNKQFDEQKVAGVKYVSMGNGFICPKENADKLNREINQAVKEQRAEEKAKREARATALKIAKLPKAERIENRKILIREAVARVQNFMDCDVLQEAVEEMYIPYILNAIAYRYNDRAFEPEVKEVYDTNITIIKELKSEIEAIQAE